MSADLAVLAGDETKLAAGSHVWAQGVNKDFSNVSQRWIDQTMTFEQGFEHLEKERRERHDFEFERSALKFDVDDDGKFVVVIDGENYRPTIHACRQLAKWLKMPETVFFYFFDKDGNPKFQDMLCDCLDNARDNFKDESGEDDEKVLKFRTYTDKTLRAVLGKTYSIVDNRWYLELLQKLIPGGRLSHFTFSDADTIYGNILIPDNIRSEADSDYGGMVAIGNSEIGIRTISQCPSIFRAICMNGCVWGETEGVEFVKRHRAIVLEELAEKIRQNINKQIPLLTGGIDLLLNTRSVKIEGMMSRLMAAIIDQHKLDKDVANDAIVEWENQGSGMTGFDVIDGITRAGQLHEPKLWVASDVISGNIVKAGPKEWERLTAIGKALTPKKVTTLLGV